MDRLGRIVVVVSLVFVMSMAVIAHDERDALATKIDEMIGAGPVQAKVDLGSQARDVWNMWRMRLRQ